MHGAGFSQVLHLDLAEVARGILMVMGTRVSFWVIMLSCPWVDLNTITKALGDTQNPIIVMKCPP